MKLWAATLALTLMALPSLAEENRSRIIATGGASTVEGSAGGGIVPMAVLSGYGAREEQGGAVFVSRVRVPDYDLTSFGGSWSWRNRVELSFADQRLNHPTLSAALGVSDQTIRQSVVGLKVRVLGDILYTPYPQLSAGLQYKDNHDFFIPAAAGAKRDSDVDAYLAASKVYLGGFFGYNVLLNGVARYTRANQTGLVGFGGDLNDDHQWQAELSAGVFYNKHWLVGAEYRENPDNLSFAGEDDWQTAFVAWFPNKHIALVAAYVDLGEVATLPDQDGWYLSVQGSF
ncbi:DUF3034 family protein [Gilvimarinus xylanilyticus]|uniref:DUF3034 family protein n=1 Tax=Gilvimarinus xylanilyticus TaxID=2944139 RepID=A0A9X2KU66_9GAMM|nr:DUF3034 family protein [Gilvimarinus xylanilyticus]MCP8900014.1 DUF3034 family protein [Gilvimarinus xylanilyticus]